MKMALQADLKRRRFLRWGAALAVTGALGWRFLWPARGVPIPELRHLTEAEGRILAAVYSAITGETDPVELAAAAARMDAFLSNLGRIERFELRAAIQLVEQSPLLLMGALPRFSSLSMPERIRCLESWRDGPGWARPVFSGLKELSYLVFYTDPRRWLEIGYSGPMVPENPNPGMAPGRYTDLTARGEAGT